MERRETIFRERAGEKHFSAQNRDIASGERGHRAASAHQQESVERSAAELAPQDASTAGTDVTVAECFSELYERHVSRVYNYLRSRTPNDEDAADLTQQTFVQALHAFPRYSERGVPIQVWLLRIARNLAIAAHRRSARSDNVTVSTVGPDLDLLPESLQPLASDAQQPEKVVLQQEKHKRLRDLVAQLDQYKRELLVLRFVSRLTAKEIAQVVGKSEAAVQKQLRRTLDALKEQYDEED
jgi:RNA polymerase sigma-70 factor, ECF subfamily